VNVDDLMGKVAQAAESGRALAGRSDTDGACIADYSDNAVDLVDARKMVEQAEAFVTTVRSILERPEPDVGQVPEVKP